MAVQSKNDIEIVRRFLLKSRGLVSAQGVSFSLNLSEILPSTQETAIPMPDRSKISKPRPVSHVVGGGVKKGGLRLI